MSKIANITKETVQITFPIVITKTLPRIPTPTESKQIQRAVDMLLIGLHWVIKLDWDKKHKIPTSKEVAITLKPLGEYLYQTFLLCSAVQARQNLLPSQLPNYDDASEWFMSIFVEKIQSLFSEVFDPIISDHKEKPIITYDGHEKRRIVRDILEYPRLVEKGIKPFKQTPDLSNLSTLLDAAILMAKESSQFKNNYLKPFTKSWRELLRDMETDKWQREFIKDGKLCQQYSKGKGVKVLNDFVTQVDNPEMLILWCLQPLTANS
ncbi:MAG TPA: hypothetical protein V6C95_23585 [Coleofasciculaceae cyanobacterium]